MSMYEKKKNIYRFLFAGGGTGGHLFPAIAVAEKIRSKIPDAEIIFVGSKSKIEGRVVPKLGFSFKSIWIKGFARRFSIENVLFPIKLIVSLMQSFYINMKFKPRVAIGSGGYASGPAIWGASVMGAKVILLEQNSYPGVTSRMLEKYADEIHISFKDSEKYFRNKEKLKLTGTPVRENLSTITKDEALKKYGFIPSKRTLLVIGGSLGAASINQAVGNSIEFFKEKEIQVLWQTGKNYFEKYEHYNSGNIIVKDFIEEMNFAYSACDLLLARAGATTIAELLNLAIPAMLVPSPNVAANHQYFNAKSLADNDAAVLIEDTIIKEKLKDTIDSLIFNPDKLNALKINAKKLSKTDAADLIAQSAINYAETI